MTACDCLPIQVRVSRGLLLLPQTGRLRQRVRIHPVYLGAIVVIHVRVAGHAAAPVCVFALALQSAFQAGVARAARAAREPVRFSSRHEPGLLLCGQCGNWAAKVERPHAFLRACGPLRGGAVLGDGQRGTANPSGGVGVRPLPCHPRGGAAPRALHGELPSRVTRFHCDKGDGVRIHVVWKREAPAARAHVAQL